MDIQQRLTAFAMLGASWVMWLLVGLSVVAIAIILERIDFLVDCTPRRLVPRDPKFIVSELE